MTDKPEAKTEIQEGCRLCGALPCDQVNNYPDISAPKRYWMIEQPDLDEDDDYKRIHTTDLDVYPDAIVLGEYALIEPRPAQPAGGVGVDAFKPLFEDVRKGLSNQSTGGEVAIAWSSLKRIEISLDAARFVRHIT